MSYDIMLRTKVDADAIWRIGHELHEIAKLIREWQEPEAMSRLARLGDVNAALRPSVVFDWNTTCDYAPMFQEAFGHSIRNFSGRRAQDVSFLTYQAIEAMKANPQRFDVHDAKNGLGTYEQLLPQLEALAAACAAYPNAIVEVT